MKIVVEFVRAEQHWNPDTEAQVNYLVFAFGGREHKIACTEEDVIKAVRAAKGSQLITPQHETSSEELADPFADPGLDAHAAALGRMSDDEDPEADKAAAELEREFGGDFDEDAPVQNPPVMFEQVDAPKPRPTENSELIRKKLINQGLESRPRSRDKILSEKQARMRQIAQQAPYSRVAADESGNPITSAASAGAAGPGPTVGKPTIVRKPLAVAAAGDDDPVEQG
jgi:hypothetical protein